MPFDSRSPGALRVERSFLDGASVLSFGTGEAKARGVGSPFGVDFKVLIHDLMADEISFVSPLTGCELLVERKLTDLGPVASLLPWLILGVDVVKNGSLGDGCEHIGVHHAGVLIGELRNFSSGSEG